MCKNPQVEIDRPAPVVAGYIDQDPLRRRACEPVGLVVDAHGDLRQSGRVLPVVMRAEQQLQAVWEQGPDVSLGAAAVTAVPGGKRPGKGPVRRLAPLLPVSASGPELASAQDDHLPRSPGSALLKSTPGDANRESDGTCGAIAGRYDRRRMRSCSRWPSWIDLFSERAAYLARPHQHHVSRADGKPQTRDLPHLT